MNIVPYSQNQLRKHQDPGQNPARVYLASLAPGSRETMYHSLDAIAKIVNPESDIDSFPWHMLRAQHTSAIRAQLADRYDSATTNKILSALRRTIYQAWRLELMNSDDYMRAIDIQNVKGDKPEQAAGRALSYGEIIAMLASCADGSKQGIRDAAIFSVGYGAGLRRSEIATLQLDNYSNGKLRIKGKRNKTRVVPLPEGAKEAIEDWISVRGAEPGTLFFRMYKGDKITDQQLTPHAIQVILDERATAAGIEKFTPHDLRRTYAGDLLDAAVDMATVQKLMGHSDPKTTASYDRRGSRAREDAAKKLHVPYQKRKK